MTEQWVDVKGWEGIYKVSNLGRVLHCPTGRLKVATVRKTGYVIVTLVCRPKNMWKQYKLHRLVAENFIPNPENLPCINHKDENKQNNRADNLEWCSHKYNSNYGHCRENISRALMGNKNGVIKNEDERRRHSDATKLLWQSPDYRDKVIAGLKRSRLQDTSDTKQLF